MILSNDPKAYAIMGCAMRVHSTLGYGFLESAYGDALEIEFKKNGIPYVREDTIRIYYDGLPLPTNWRADFTCFDRSYIVELKALRSITKIVWAQVIHYMRATRIPYAMLLNFGRPQLQYDTFDLDKLQAEPRTWRCGEAADIKQGQYGRVRRMSNAKHSPSCGAVARATRIGVPYSMPPTPPQNSLKNRK